MRNNLIYQSSEFDCGPTTLTNALRFLFDRDEVPPHFLKSIWMLCNDVFNEEGELGKWGTSRGVMRYFGDWTNNYAKGCKFPIKAKYVKKEKAVMTPDGQAWQCLCEGGCVVMRCWSDGYGHYVLLTGIDDGGNVLIWDPYDEDDELGNPLVRQDNDHPKQYNRVVHPSIIERTDVYDYAMGEYSKREMLLMWRTPGECKRHVW
ncbi:MAG: peptidase C39 [Clostridia bacterium]|nr:peptidase C39 [Clostridia bacterium]